MNTSDTLESLLRRLSAEGELFEREGEETLRCVACGHRCRLREGQRGICKVRWVENGRLRVPRGYVAGLACDPIEKKPFFHVLPGSDALSFGMLGCDFHCPFCQNWISSQALRDPVAGSRPQEISAERIVDLAAEYRAPIIASTYNEPLITAEWAHEILTIARSRGIRGAFVSNGNATPEVLDYLRPVVDFYKVDLKAFRPESYRELGGVLDRVLETIRGLVDRGFWVEIVTLVVPGFNDSREELRDIARFVRSVSPDIPWHITAFYGAYRMSDGTATTAQQLLTAAELGREEGLHFVYAGNLPGSVGDWEDTACPRCGARLVHRRGFTVLENRIRPDGSCPECGHRIPGFWSTAGEIVPPAPTA